MDRREWLKSAGLAATVAAAQQVAAQTTVPKAAGKLKIMVSGGHPGDPEYGCGGTVARLTALGHEVVLLYLNDGAWPPTPAPVRIAEAKKACEILKARPLYAGQQNGHAIVDRAHYDAFLKIVEAEGPDAIFNQWPIDNHADHRAISNLTYNAWNELQRRFALYYYEVSDGEDTLQFAPTHFVDISDVETVKRQACYAHVSQSPDRYYEVQDTVARFRGLQSGYNRAEAFIRQNQNPFDIFGMAGLPVR